MQAEHTLQVSRRELSRRAKFFVYGKKYRGVASLLPPRKALVEQLDDRYFSCYVDRYGHWILRRLELFPCFDQADRIHENRFYRNYFICDSEAMLRDAYEKVRMKTDRLYALAQSLLLPPLICADDDAKLIVLIMPIL